MWITKSSGINETDLDKVMAVEEYLIVAQDRTEATLFRRTNNWHPESFSRTDQTIRFNSIGLTLSLGAMYEGIS